MKNCRFDGDGFYFMFNMGDTKIKMTPSCSLGCVIQDTFF